VRKLGILRPEWVSDEVKDGAFQEMLDGALIRDVEHAFLQAPLAPRTVAEKMLDFLAYGRGYVPKAPTVFLDSLHEPKGISPGEFTVLYGKRRTGMSNLMYDPRWLRTMQEPPCRMYHLVQNPPGKPKTEERYLSALSRTST